jgi:hypothetical protein
MKKVATLSVLLAIALLVTPCYATKPATKVPSGVKVYDALPPAIALRLE